MASFFRTNTGMRFFALPTTQADNVNASRKGIVDLGIVSPAELLDQTKIFPHGTLVCGPLGRTYPIIEALTRQSRLPFVMIGAAADFSDTPLCQMDVQWSYSSMPSHLPAGNGRITLDSEELQLNYEQISGFTSHLIFLCLGQGLSLTAALLDQLNAAGNYVLISSSPLSCAVSHAGTGNLLTEETLLRTMRCLVISSIIGGGDAQTLLRVLPTFESEQVTNNFDFSTHRENHWTGMMGHHGGTGFRIGQNRSLVTKPILSVDDLICLRSNSQTLVYNQDLLRVWVGVVS